MLLGGALAAIGAAGSLSAMTAYQASESGPGADPAASVVTADRIAALCAVPVLWLALAGPLFSTPFFQQGVWNRAEPLVVAGFAAAALAALVLVGWMIAGGRPSRSACLLVLPVFGLAVWLMASGPGGFAAAEWRERLLGVPQSGLGALWYGALGIWMLLGDLVLRQAVAWRLTVLGASLAALAVLLVQSADLLLGGSSLLLVKAYYAWPGIMLPAMALALPKAGGLDRLQLGAVLLLSIGLLLLGAAATLIAAAFLGLALALLWPRFAAARAPRTMLLWLLVTVAALAPLVLISMPDLVRSFTSLEARRLTWLVVRGVLEHEPLTWLIGQGAGSMPDTMAAELNNAGVALWRQGEWDFLWRDYFHAHNWILQSLHDGGLPALLLLAWLICQPLWLAPMARRGIAMGVVVAYLLGIGVWFELIFLLPFMALAWAALVHPETPKASSLAPSGAAARRLLPGAGILALLCLAATLFWGAYVLQRFSREFQDQIAWFAAVDDLVPIVQAPPPLPVDPRRSDLVAADFMRHMTSNLIIRHERLSSRAVNTAGEAQRIAWMIEIMRARLPETTSARFAVQATRVISEIILRPSLEPYRLAMLSSLPLWQLAIERALALAPRRIDVALEYLNWTLQQGLHERTLAMARLLRQRNTEDPLGLFFEGGVMALKAELGAREQGMALLRRAVAAGVEQFIPLEESFKAQIGAKSQ